MRTGFEPTTSDLVDNLSTPTNARMQGSASFRSNYLSHSLKQTKENKGEIPGLVVMGGDSCSKRCEF